MPTTPRRPAAVRTSHRLATGLLGLVVLDGSLGAAGRRLGRRRRPVDGPRADHPLRGGRSGTPTTRSTFAPGGRVTVGFRATARRHGRWSAAPPRGPCRPAACSRDGAACAPRPRAVGPGPGARRPRQPRARRHRPAPPTAAPTATDRRRALAPVAPATATASTRHPRRPRRSTQPSVDPSAVIAGRRRIVWTAPVRRRAPTSPPRSTPSGLRKEVFGFLPYWELSDSSTVLDYAKLSTIAFFGVGAVGQRQPREDQSRGATTVGWSGWTSSRMTTVINDAHRNHTRVVLTVQSFAWSTAGAQQAEGPARQCDRAADPGQDHRDDDPRPRRRRRQPRLRADRVGLRRGVHRPRPRRPGRARQGPEGLPADVRHDRLHRQLPDRGGDGGGRGGRDHRSWATTIARPSASTAGSIAPLRRSGLRHHRHDRGLHRAGPGLQAHPRRALLRPRLVDRERRPATARRPSTAPSSSVDLRQRPRLPGRPRPSLRRRPSRSPGPSIDSPRPGASCTSTTPRRCAPSTTWSTTTGCAASGSGPSATTGAGPSCGRPSATSSSPTAPPRSPA